MGPGKSFGRWSTVVSSGFDQLSLNLVNRQHRILFKNPLRPRRLSVCSFNGSTDLQVFSKMKKKLEYPAAISCVIA